MSRTAGRSGPDPSTLTVAITGGARGIGAATARLLRDAGADVLIGDLDVATLERTATELGIRSHPLDVTAPASWTAFAAAAGGVDVLINNAGIMPTGPVLEETEESVQRTFGVNTFGVIHGTRTFGPGMVGRGSGHIVNVASAVGRVALAGGASYSASKHAVVGYSEAARQELAPLGVEVSMVLPVIVDTRLGAGVAPTRGVPTMSPEQVARVIVDVIRRPVPEAWAPRWGQPVTRVAQALPRRVQAMARKALHADAVLTGADRESRRAYEESVRRS